MLLEAYEAGQRDFGENKVQEICRKKPGLPGDIRWHMIGHLQRNKVKYVVGRACLIHSVDSYELAGTVLKYNKNVTTADSVEEAAEMAMLLAGQKQNKCAIVAYGSLSYLGRLKKYVTDGVCVRV